MANRLSENQKRSRWRIIFYGVGVLLIALTIFVIVDAFTLTEEERGVWRDPSLIPFKCTNCGSKVFYHLLDIEKMIGNSTTFPTKGPLYLKCPECGKKTLCQAVICVACKEIYVMKLDTVTGKYNDLCPACGKSYVKLWQDKYRQSQESPGDFKADENDFAGNGSFSTEYS